MPYSSHHCLGGWAIGINPASLGADLGSVDAPLPHLIRNQKERTCLFRRVCVLPRQGWTYFADDHSEFAQVRNRFRAVLDVSARGNFAQSDERSVDHSFALRRGVPVPANGPWLRTHTLVKVAALAPANLGHFLGNGLYPAFVASWRLAGENARVQSVQLMLAGHNQSDANSQCRHMERLYGTPPDAQAARSAARCSAHASIVSKFVRHLLPGLTDAPLLWEEELMASRRARSAGGRLCVRALVIGTGDLGFSTVHRLANSTDRRRPPQPLWGVFIDHMLKRLDQRSRGGNGATTLLPRPLLRAARAARTDGHWESRAMLGGASRAAGAASMTCASLWGAVMVVKHGRRSLPRKDYSLLQLHAERVLGMAVTAIDAGRMPLRLQLAHTRRALIGISSDGGASFLLSFLPRGGALVVLGSLERWLWSTDGRLRAFYCQPRKRDIEVRCPTAWDLAAQAHVAPAHSRSNDCFSLEAVLPCVEVMLGRARKHVLQTRGACLASANGT